MANLDLATLLVKIEGDISDINGKFDEVAKQSNKAKEKVVSQWQDAADRVGKLGQKMTTLITLPLMAAGTAAVKMASDLTETFSKTNEVFKESANTVLEWSNNSIENMGMAQQTALDMASSFGDMGTSMGFTTEEAANMSMQLVQLAADMASFKNISVERANTALTAIYTGETESLKAMGIVMTEANLEQFALAEGCKTTYKNMSQTEKVMLRYRYVLAMTTNAQGDFVRTGNSLANQTRKLGENVKQTATSFGKLLEPAITSIVSSLNDAVSWVDSLSDSTKRAILIAAEIVAAIGPVLLAMTGIIKAITAVKSALALLSANPIVLGITAVGAALAALGVIVANFKGQIDETYSAYDAVQEALSRKVSANIDTTSVDNAQQKLNSLEGKDVEANVNVNVEDGTEEKIDNLNAKLETLKGDKTAVGVFVFDEVSAETLEDYKTSLAEATIAISNFDDAVGNLDAIAERTAAEQKAIVTQKMLADSANLYAALQAGTIGVDEYNAQMAELAINAQKATVQIDRNTEAQKELNKQFSDGLEDLSTWGINYALMMQNSGLATERLTIANDAAAASIQAIINGTATASDYIVAQTAILQQQQAQVEQLAQAEENYNAQIAANADEHERTVAAQQQAAEYSRQMAEAYDTVDTAMLTASATSETFNRTLKDYPELAAELIRQTGASVEQLNPYSAAAQAASESNTVMGDAVDYVAEQLNNGVAPTEALIAAMEKFPEVAGQLPEVLGASYSNIEDVYGRLGTLATEWEEAEKTALDNVKQAHADFNSANTAAEETYKSELLGIQRDYNTDELNLILDMCEQNGYALDDNTKNSILSMSAMLDGMADAVEDGSPEVVEQAHEMGNSVIDEVDALADGGITGGSDFVNGLIAGMENREGALYKKVRQIVSNTVAEARKAEDANSPAKVPAKKIGKPFMQGIEVGMDDYMPSLLKTVKRNVNDIITAGTGTINSNYKTFNNNTNVARQGNVVVNQTNNFTSRTLSPYEQQQQIRRLDKQLAEVFA